MFRGAGLLALAICFVVTVEAQRSAVAAPTPKSVTISQLQKRMSHAELISLLGREALKDSSYTPSPDTSLNVRMLRFMPVVFENQQASVSAMLKDDTAIGFSVTIPRRGKATIEDFTRLRRSIADEIGEPTAYTDTYIDYMLKGMQTVFGVFKDGTIRIDIFRLGS